MGGTKWPNFKNNNLLTPANDVIPMLRSEARSLEKKTGGKVKATFSKIEYGRNGITQMLDTASTISRACHHMETKLTKMPTKLMRTIFSYGKIINLKFTANHIDFAFLHYIIMSFIRWG
mgnify:CR=1 FL=1